MVKGMLLRLLGGEDTGRETGRTGLVLAAVACAAAVLIGVALRLNEVPEWSASRFFAAGERLMSTHDAYAWLAGAKETSRYVLGPLARLMAFLHGVTGLSLGTLGFWMPVVFAPLAALPVVLLVWRMGRPEAGATAGAMAVGCFGFLLRTRVGYLDTDVLTLFFAVTTAAALCLWLAPLCRPGWLPGSATAGPEPEREQPAWLALALALPLGLLLHVYTVRFYSSGRPIVWAFLGMSVALGLLLARPGRRGRVLLGLALAVTVWLYPLLGLALGLAAVVLARVRPALLTPGRTLAAGAALLAGVFLFRGYSDAVSYLALIGAYLRSAPVKSAGGAAGSSLYLPSVIASVREASLISFQDVVNLTSVHWSLFVAALAGLALAVARYPLLAVWLPLLGLGLASVKLGMRFNMYLGPVLGLGLGLGLAEVLALLRAGRKVRWPAHVALLVLVGWILTVPLVGFIPFPVLSKPFAETLVGLRAKLPRDAMLWQWWDFGYAAQYYAERDTFGDGGRHDGQFLYPLALVHATTSPMQAAQMMKFMAATLAEQRQEARDKGQSPYPPARLEFFPEFPMARLEAMGREKAAGFVRSLATEPQQWPAHLPEQYLVLAWDNLILGTWINRYGNWSLDQGEGSPGKISPLQGDLRMDPQNGVLNTPQGKVTLSELTVIDESGRIGTMFWARLGGFYVVINRMSNEVFVMERKVYDSMMVRMLLGNPRDYEPYFELVADNAPWCRVYRAR